MVVLLQVGGSLRHIMEKRIGTVRKPYCYITMRAPIFTAFILWVFHRCRVSEFFSAGFEKTQPFLEPAGCS